MAKSFPINTVICLDVLGQPLMRGDYVMYDMGGEEIGGVVIFNVAGPGALYIVRADGQWNRILIDFHRVRMMKAHEIVQHKLMGLFIDEIPVKLSSEAYSPSP